MSAELQYAPNGEIASNASNFSLRCSRIRAKGFKLRNERVIDLGVSLTLRRRLLRDALARFFKLRISWLDSLVAVSWRRGPTTPPPSNDVASGGMAEAGRKRTKVLLCRTFHFVSLPSIR